MPNLRLTVNIRSLKNQIYQSEVYMLSSFNKLGQFTVLPMHANFISVIHDQIILFENDLAQPTNHFNIQSGILKLTDNKVEIFLGIETTTQ